MKIKLRLHPVALAYGLLASLLAVSVVLAAVVTIDTFDVGNQRVEATSANPIVDDFVSNPAILGTERDVQVRWLAGSTVRILVGPSQGSELVFSVGSGNLGTGLVTYDGDDSSPALDPSGLCSNPPAGCVDLTGGGTNNSLHFEAVYNNVPFQVEFRVYSGSASDYLHYVLELPGSIDLNGHVDFLLPFSAFTSVGNGADFMNVGAFEIFFNGAISPGAKLNLDLFRADSWRDFGDAPASYGVVEHLPDGVRLGISVDAEENQLSSANARGDDSNQSDDEDGVVRTPGLNWSILGGGSVDLVLNGCTAFPCYLNGWVDWNKDGVFGAGEQIFSDLGLSSNGGHTLPFTISGDPVFNTTYFARFRICTSQGECSTPGGSAGSGEVEDYLWAFGPTAVVLNNLTAQTGSLPQYIIILSVVAALLLLGITVSIWVRRHRKA